MPFEERTIQEYGVVIDHIFFWDDALRPCLDSRARSSRLQAPSQRPLSLALRFLTLPLLIKTLQRARLQKLAGEWGEN